MQLIPRPLEYAYALVVSRCFTMADGDTFAFVPFIDLCQHAATPNANFTSVDDGFELRALTDVVAGEEVRTPQCALERAGCGDFGCPSTR